MRSLNLARLGAGATFLVCFAAHAATPASGTLAVDTPELEFGGGPFVSTNVTPFGVADALGLGSHVCQDPVLQCDHYELTVDLPDNLAENFPSALIRMTFTWGDITGAGVEDYDIFVNDANGNEVNSAATDQQPEVMVQLAQAGVDVFTFDVVPFLTLASSYEAVIKLDLGEPAEGVDPDEFFGQGLLATVNPRSSESPEDPRSAPAGSNGGGGALGGFLVLALAAFGLRRRGYA